MTYEPWIDERDDPLEGHCRNCGKPCRAILVDMGIGPYEFWGARGVDKRMVPVSPCCEEDVVEVQLPCHVPCLHFGDYECLMGHADFEHREKGCPDYEPAPKGR